MTPEAPPKSKGAAMSLRNTLPALLLSLCLGAPAVAGTTSGDQSREPSGPVVNEDFCPG
jgi:hypothetical protein